MEWDLMEKLYLAIMGIFDGFVHFLYGIFGKDKAE